MLLYMPTILAPYLVAFFCPCLYQLPHKSFIKLYSNSPNITLCQCQLDSAEEATLVYSLLLGVAFTKLYSFRNEMAGNALCDACH